MGGNNLDDWAFYKFLFLYTFSAYKGATFTSRAFIYVLDFFSTRLICIRCLPLPKTFIREGSEQCIMSHADLGHKRNQLPSLTCRNRQRRDEGPEVVQSDRLVQ